MRNNLQQENNTGTNTNGPNISTIPIFSCLPGQPLTADQRLTFPVFQQPNDSLIAPCLNLGGLISSIGSNALATNINTNLANQPSEVTHPPGHPVSTELPENHASPSICPPDSSSSTKSNVDFGSLFQLISQLGTEMKTSLLNDPASKEIAQSSGESGEPSSVSVPPNSNPGPNLLATSLRMSASLILQSAQLFEFVGLAAAAAHNLSPTNTGNVVHLAPPSQIDLDAVNASPVGVE
ncbi:hypothetical protein FGIG_03264 [Fasciola gigantica]|uniref:Uncharacterized protein n=1 Tax=Fasciola gigantica TaxID=46835 RepID=A0A504WSL3_FASGI|nr:hypothetical protein FGIG_03264 [Fasciola gigantica]